MQVNAECGALYSAPPERHPERRVAESNSRRRERGRYDAASAPRARRDVSAEGSKRRFLLLVAVSCFTFGFSYASPHRRFRSRARALFTLPRVNKVRLRTGFLSHRSTVITLLCSAQNDACGGEASTPLSLAYARQLSLRASLFVSLR